MNSADNQIYEFGPFRLDKGERVLLRSGNEVPLRPKVFDVLVFLVEHRGRLVGKDELLSAVWPGQFVEEGNLNKNISMLRQALGESSMATQYIETVPKHGYRFVASVAQLVDTNTDLLVFEKRRRMRIITEEEPETNSDHSSELAFTQYSNATRTASAANDIILGPSFISSFLATVKPAPIAGLLILSTLFVAAVSIAIGLGVFSKGAATADRKPAVLTGKINLTTISDTTNAADAAISPDGNYLLYRSVEGTHESLWLRQIAIGSNRQITPQENVEYWGLSFSRDGSYIYYSKKEKNADAPALYRMPTLGGVSVEVKDGVWSRISFSPDNTRFAFVRKNIGKREEELIIANANGSEEFRLTTRTFPNSLGAPAWSPDGSVIVCSAGNSETGSPNHDVIEFQVADGHERSISRSKWRWAGDVGWLTDGMGLVLIAKEQESEPYQLWHLSYPDGEARRITSDLNYYRSISLSADSTQMVTVQATSRSDIWILPGGEQSQAKQITSAYDGLAWTPDGRIVYSSHSRNNDIWIMDPDGSNKKQLTVNAGRNIGPNICSNGRYIVFVSDRSGVFNIWRMNVDGSNPVRLTTGKGEKSPVCSPDGNWVLYIAAEDRTLWRVPIEGDTPVQVTGNYSSTPAMSPDGRWIAYFQNEPPAKVRIAVIPFEGGKPVRMLEVPPHEVGSSTIRWTPNGHAFTYVLKRNGVSNIWRQPINGGAPEQLTHFNSDEIFSFDWSRDGKQLACWRGGWTYEVVLISGFL